MEKLYKPAKLDVDPNSPTATKEWKHWSQMFENFFEHLGESIANKLRLLVSCISFRVYEYIADCRTYESAINVLEELYVKKGRQNVIFARHLLSTRQQKDGECLEEFL